MVVLFMYRYLFWTITTNTPTAETLHKHTSVAVKQVNTGKHGAENFRLNHAPASDPPTAYIDNFCKMLLVIKQGILFYIIADVLPPLLLCLNFRHNGFF